MDLQCETMLLPQVTSVTISLSSVPRGTFSAPGAPVIYMVECSAFSWECPPGSPCRYGTDTSLPGLHKTCSLLGGDRNYLHCIQQHYFGVWNLFSSLSSCKTQSEQNLCSCIFSSLLRPWNINLRRYKHLIHTMVITWKSVRLFKCCPRKPSMCYAEWNYHCSNGTLNGSAESCRKCVIIWQQ